MGVDNGEDGERKAQAYERKVEGRPGVESDAYAVQISMDDHDVEQNGVASLDGQVDMDYRDDNADRNQPAAVALLAAANAGGDDGVEVRVWPQGRP